MSKEKIDVRFDGPTLAQIQEIERLSGKPTLAILRECVNLTNWIYKARATGARLMLRRRAEPDREVVFPP